jgi:hypothetical protein
LSGGIYLGINLGVGLGQMFLEEQVALLLGFGIGLSLLLGLRLELGLRFLVAIDEKSGQRKDDQKWLKNLLMSI